jgi:hypothetical protein
MFECIQLHVLIRAAAGERAHAAAVVSLYPEHAGRRVDEWCVHAADACTALGTSALLRKTEEAGG